MDKLEIAKNTLLNSYNSYVERMIYTIFTYIWPNLFDEKTKVDARETLKSALKHVDEYPCFERDKYQNVCTGLFAKLAWYYAEDAKIERDDHFYAIYAMFLDKGWQPTLEDVKAVNYAANKEAYLAYLYNKNPPEVTRVRLGESVEARIYRNDVGVIDYKGHYVNLDLKHNVILGVDFDGVYVKIGDVIGDAWKILAINSICDTRYMIEVSCI